LVGPCELYTDDGVLGDVVSTFSCIRKPFLEDLEAASRDNEIPRTFFANHHSGNHYNYFFKENGIWHWNILTPLTQRNDFGDIMDDLQEQELFTV
jgi:hypothetical protein